MKGTSNPPRKLVKAFRGTLYSCENERDACVEEGGERGGGPWGGRSSRAFMIPFYPWLLIEAGCDWWTTGWMVVYIQRSANSENNASGHCIDINFRRARMDCGCANWDPALS